MPRAARTSSAGWGGKRDGAGRKPAGAEPRRPVTVWLTDEQAARLRELGDGNASAGVRRLLEQTPAPP
jgi:hypothetical protein